MPYEVSDVLSTVTAELVDAGVEDSDITPDAVLDDLDITSLDVAQILAAIKTRHGVSLDPPDLAGLTVGQLVEKVASAT